MAAREEAGRTPDHTEQVGQGLFPDHHVSGLFDQRDTVPLAESEHHVCTVAYGSAVHPSSRAREQGAAFRSRVQDGSHAARCRRIYIPGHGGVCQA